MKRESNGSSHPAMFRRQPVKRSDGLGIAQDARDLAACGGVGRLALGAGLGIHGSAIAELDGRCFQRGDVCSIGLRGLGQLAGDLVAADLGDGLDEGGHRVGAAGFSGLHFVSPKRANPADESSSHVTSDTSTPSAKEILNGGAA